METCSVVLTLSLSKKSCGAHAYHSNETCSAELLHDTICFSMFYNVKFGIFLGFRLLAILLCIFF